MSDPIFNVVDGIENVLRYVAPGFVALTVIAVGTPELMQKGGLLREMPTGGLVAGATLGVLLNSIHIAFLEDGLCVCVLRLLRKFIPDLLPNDMQDHSSMRQLLMLEVLREERRSSPSAPMRQFQVGHDRLGATLTFLYCASYPCILMPLFRTQASVGARLATFAVGALLLLLGVCCDCRYTWRDVLAVRQFGQELPTNAFPKP